MARPVTIIKVLATADDNGIAETQTPLAAGNLTLNGALVVGGVAILDTQRRVIVTSAGDDTGITFTVYGTNGSGASIHETIAGKDTAAAETSLDFKTVTRVYSSGAVDTGGVIVGTNSEGSTEWVAITPHLTPSNLSTAVKLGGTVTYTVEYTYNDVNFAPDSFYAYQQDNVIPVVWPDATVASKSTSMVATMNEPIWAARVTINSGTDPLTATFVQAGIAGN